MSTTREALIRESEEALRRESTPETVKEVLLKILAAFDCVLGTVHRYNGETRLLELVAHKGLPDSLLERVATIPIGKGMAGLAAERREAIQVCNLQTDDSGVAKPGARDTNMEGSVSLPMLVDGELRGTLGVAKPTAYEFSESERDQLLELGTLVGRYLSAPSAAG